MQYINVSSDESIFLFILMKIPISVTKLIERRDIIPS